MASTYVYPSAFEQYEIAQDLVDRSLAGRLGLKLFPVRNQNTFEVRWWQKDNSYGRMHFRGVDGKAGPVQRLGANQFMSKPGVFGDQTTVTEGEILERAPYLTQSRVLDMTEYVMDANALLAQRMANRDEDNIWQICLTGTLNIPLVGPTGTTFWTATYPVATFAATIPLSTYATATPILNLQTIQQKGVGHSSAFGPDATVYINQITANNMINNTNASDLDGRRDMYGATLNNLPAISNYFKNQGLPGVEIYDEGYQNQPVAGPITNVAQQFTKYISNGVGTCIGKRPNGEPVGHNIRAICANNIDNAPGIYSFINNYGLGINAPKEVPARLEINMGYNGMPVVEYPSAVCAISGW